VSTLDDLIAWGEMLATQDVRRAFPGAAIPEQTIDAAARERASDALRPGEVITLVERVRAEDASDEARAALRIVTPLYLAAAAPALEETCRTHRASALASWAGNVDAALAAEPDRQERRTIARQFLTALDRLESLDADRSGARDEAARRLGLGDAHALWVASRDPARAEATAEIERGFVVPTDDAVVTSVRQSARRSAIPDEPIAPYDVPRLAWFPEHRKLLAAGRLRGVLRGLAGPLRFREEDGGPKLDDAGALAVSTAFDGIFRPALVVLGTWGGPKGLLETLDAFGRAARATFVAATRGAPALGRSDPAFAFAAGALFRGIGGTSAGLRAAELPGDDGFVEAIRLEKLIDTRRAWGAAAAEGASPSSRDAIARRAGARPLSLAEGDAAAREDGDPSSRLTGLIFATLLEERLLTRFGRAWFCRPDAGTYVRDVWAADCDESPRRMARALSLGTMDSAPLIEACLPMKGRVC
jgi:hypothetical protein